MKITKKFQCHNLLWHGGYLLSKDQENSLACFKGIANFKFLFFLDNTKRAGWRSVLPNEKHEFSAGWRAAQKGGPAGCTTGWASGLHIKAIWQAAH